MSDTDPDSLQPGWITRARSLREIFPLVALGDALSAATSLLALLLSVAVLALTTALAAQLDAPLLDGFGRGARLPLPEAIADVSPRGMSSVAATAGYVQHPLVALVASLGEVGLWRALLAQSALLVLWFIPLGFVVRQSALMIAGRNRMSFLGGVRFVLGRWQAMLLGPLIPLVGVALLWVACWAIAALCDVVFPTDLGAVIAALLAFPFFALAGLLLGGLILALPLIWSAAVIEQDVDSFDAVSRGFEYLFQRPLRFVLYVLVAALIWLIVVWLAGYLLRSGVALYASAGERSPPFTGYAWDFAQFLLRAFGLNLLWALAAGVYLLVRRDQNHREIDEVWEPPMAVDPLPELPQTAE